MAKDVSVMELAGLFMANYFTNTLFPCFSLSCFPECVMWTCITHKLCILGDHNRKPQITSQSETFLQPCLRCVWDKWGFLEEELLCWRRDLGWWQEDAKTRLLDLCLVIEISHLDLKPVELCVSAIAVPLSTVWQWLGCWMPYSVKSDCSLKVH